MGQYEINIAIITLHCIDAQIKIRKMSRGFVLVTVVLLLKSNTIYFVFCFEN